MPNANWAQGAREAFNIWHDMLPLELTAETDEADIRFDWEAGRTRNGRRARKLIGRNFAAWETN